MAQKYAIYKKIHTLLRLLGQKAYFWERYDFYFISIILHYEEEKMTHSIYTEGVNFPSPYCKYNKYDV